MEGDPNDAPFLLGARWLSAATFCILLGGVVSAQKAHTQDQDEDFARSVKEWTTKPEFISPLVDHLPKVPGVPSPKDVLGHHIGAPGKLTYHADSVAHYRALATKTPRVKVYSVGTTDEGRECVVVAVGSEESMKNIDQYRSYLAQLADPRKITAEQAREIITKAKPIYHVMGGLHSAETGPTEMLMELAYRIATEDSPVINQTSDNVIVTITPVAESDGRDRYVDWSVLSGLMKGATEIRNRPAIVDVPIGRGRVLLFSTNPCYRWQNFGEFNMLFNAVLNFNDIKTAKEGRAARRQPGQIVDNQNNSWRSLRSFASLR